MVQALHMVHKELQLNDTSTEELTGSLLKACSVQSKYHKASHRYCLEVHC